MKLDRNKLGNDGRGKYALIKVREVALFEPPEAFATSPVLEAIKTLEDAGVLDWGEVNTEAEFFVIRLKDKYALAALVAYAQAAFTDDPEYAKDIADLVCRAGANSRWCKRPD